LDSFIVTIDQGSSATKVLAFNHEGVPVYRAVRPLKIERPQPAYVEQDPIHVLEQTRSAIEEVLFSIEADGHEVLSIGLACQRSSFLLWSRETGEPLTPIISWQDLRAKTLCQGIGSQREVIYQKTGLPLTGHYGGPKFLWLTRHDPRVSQWVQSSGTIFSPWNSFLLWHLTEERVCVTDESVAGRTLFFNIHERRWDQDLLCLFNVPESTLPDLRPTCGFYGHYPFRKRMIPIVCSIGDHQAALLGLGGFEKGECGLNYGTSGGVLVNIGPTPQIMKGLLTNIAYSDEHQAVYTSEGTVNAVGSLFEWFERERGMKGASLHWDQQVASSSQGWFLIPGMYGIAAPYWKETVVTEFRGKGGLPNREVELRAGMESIAFLVADILDRIRKIPALSIERITAAGGAARKPLLQFQADLLGIPVYHSSIADATAMGCAFLTGLQRGFWKGIEEIQSLVQRDEVFLPAMPADQRQSLLNQWHQHLEAEGIFI